MSAVIMVQGTSSDAGKSLLCAALCRYFSDSGYSVAPFKAQNMALNAMAVPGGGEIGWAQVMQAEAARVTPTVEMNPLLLKPVSDTVCQVVLQGRPLGEMSAAAYQGYKKKAFATVLDSLAKLRRAYDVVVIEGAGSPAEVNLRENDIVNMGLAAAADAPVLLVSDIDRGGMFAYVAGTLALLTESERARVRAVVVNKFRGEVERLRPGLDSLEQITGKPVAGVIPYLRGLSLPAEDSLGISGTSGKEWALDVAVIRLPRIANFTDMHILAEENGVQVRYVSSLAELGKPHLIILPGSKNTLGDLAWLRECGLAAAVGQAAADGVFVVGICGGYQMMGSRLYDPYGADGTGGTADGLGLLPVETEFAAKKTTIRVSGQTLDGGEALEGYEIHLGQSRLQGAVPFARLQSEDGQVYLDGACSGDGRLLGTYLHGLFDAAPFRNAYLNRVRRAWGLPAAEGDKMSAGEKRESSYRLLSRAVSDYLDCGLLQALLESQGVGQ